VLTDNAKVDFVTSYHEEWSASKESRIIHRYVPWFGDLCMDISMAGSTACTGDPRVVSGYKG